MSDDARRELLAYAWLTPDAETELLGESTLQWLEESLPLCRAVTMLLLGPSTRSAVVLERGPEPITLGRRSSNTIVLAERSVSQGQHAEIRAPDADRAWTIHDLGSANGVVVNDQRVSLAPLRPGDVVTLGRLTLWWCATE